jgi:AcrR family transcriptional regulator
VDLSVGQDAIKRSREDEASMARQHSRRQMVSNELLEHAARLFATQGYANTSFQDIADSIGISRPALYHYVSNKEEILAALVRNVLERVVEILQDVRARHDLDEDARVQEAMRQIVVNNARNTAKFRLLDRSEPDLPAEIAEMHRQARRRVLELLVALIEDAIQAGFYRPLPARTVALGLLGMANWVAWWYRGEADGDPEEVADVLVGLAMAGARRESTRQVESGPLAALALLKEDIAHLEGALLAETRGNTTPAEGDSSAESGSGS